MGDTISSFWAGGLSSEEKSEFRFWTGVIDDYEKRGFLKTELNDEVVRKLSSGLSRRLRGMIWQFLTGAIPLIKKNRGCYQSIVDSGFDGGQRRRILIDVYRTFPHHRRFKEVKGQKNLSHDLADVLCAYSAFDREVRYCQGLNFVAAVLLLQMSPEETFWTLISMIKEKDIGWKFHGRGMLVGLFTEGTPGLAKCFSLLDYLVEKKVPAVHEHFRDISLSVSMYSTNYFMTMYAGIFPLEYVLRIWDILFFDGVDVLFKVALFILTYLEADLLKADFEGCFDLIRDFPRKHLDNTIGEATVLPTSTNTEQFVADYEVIDPNIFMELCLSIDAEF